MAENDGGPAFPRQNDDQQYGELGMSLRDWLAGQALAGNLANPDGTWPKYPVDMAKDCYKAADAVLAEREKNDDKG